MPANTPNDTDVSTTGSSETSLVWGTSSFEPGSDVGLVSRYTVGLIERDNPSTRARLWELVADEASLDDILDELSSTGLKALPDFGIAQVEGDLVRVVARGRTTITAELASGDQHEIDPSGVHTWIEEVVADVVGLTLALAPLDDAATPLSTESFAVLAGSVPARSLTRRFDAADFHADAAIAGRTATPGDPALERVEDLGPAIAPVSAPEPEPAEPSEPAGEVESAGEVELDVPEPIVDDAGDSWFTDGVAEAPAAEVPPRPQILFETETASPPPADAQPSSSLPSGSPAADARPSSPPPADPQPASPQPPGPPSGPGTGGALPASTVVVGANDGSVRGPVSSIFDDEVVADPIVPSFPSDDFTSAPGTDVAAADLGDIAAPAAPQIHGVLAFSNGERIGVDRNVLIGRNPKVAGAVEGGLPHIMKFDGPGQGLSRTHAEVRIENGALLLEDLQSTNGTEIQLPGQQRRRLRGGEPVVVVPGTLIDFGDELHCTVETAG